MEKCWLLRSFRQEAIIFVYAQKYFWNNLFGSHSERFKHWQFQSPLRLLWRFANKSEINIVSWDQHIICFICICSIKVCSGGIDDDKSLLITRNVDAKVAAPISDANNKWHVLELRMWCDKNRLSRIQRRMVTSLFSVELTVICYIISGCFYNRSNKGIPHEYLYLLIKVRTTEKWQKIFGFPSTHFYSSNFKIRIEKRNFKFYVFNILIWPNCQNRNV